MNKEVKFNKQCSLWIKKYVKIGNMAKGIKRYVYDNRKVNYLKFDNIGLEFFCDDKVTYFRDLNCEVPLEHKSRFEDYQKAFYVILGYYQRFKK